MALPNINIVWLKRDLRTQHHQPLHQAEQSEMPYLIIYIWEPNIINYPDTSLRHLQYQYHSIKVMDKLLKPFNKSVTLFYAEALEVFNCIQEKYTIQNVYSYQENGVGITYKRDIAVAKHFAKHKINWVQYQQNGVVRGAKNRDGWDKQWYVTMHSTLIANTYKVAATIAFTHNYTIPELIKNEWENYPTTYQPPGEINAYKYLQSFVNGRVATYSKHISKPLESRKSCSRLSTYLAWGNISTQQVYQFVLAQPMVYKFATTNFITRLKWRCHFVQKLEQEYTYETKCINKGFEALEHPVNETYIKAWQQGNTGYPLVDACMRCLHQTGWINFRMRAMLVSFFCHHLYQDYRLGMHHLAQLFLDYEPGIHYPQFQMQAGTTGINTIRIYNPIKQSEEQDPTGIFIKQYVLELQTVPTEHIHTPWKMTALEQHICGVVIGQNYAEPIVDLVTTGRVAREKIWGHKKSTVVKNENEKILKKHTRRKKVEEENLLFKM